MTITVEFTILLILGLLFYMDSLALANHVLF